MHTMPYRYLATSVALSYLSSSVKSEDGLSFRFGWSPFSMFLFIAFIYAEVYYGTQESHPHATVVHQPVADEGQKSKFPCGDPCQYAANGIPANTTIPHWWKQLYFDIGVYCAPALAIGLFSPKLGHFFLIWFAFFRPCYDKVMAHLLLKSSALENKEKAAMRQKSYPYPEIVATGWYRLANSDDVKAGCVNYIQACGRHYAVFRGQDGRVRCLDAFCTHMGANMALGGKVKDNCLECPFHKWQFDGTGRCAHIPYTEKIPQQADTRAYHVYEYFGMIMVWHVHLPPSPSNQFDDKVSTKIDQEAVLKKSMPQYYPPPNSSLENGSMVFAGERSMTVNMHIREFAENSTDFAHFDPLHGRMVFPFTTYEIPGITVNHIPDWILGKAENNEIHKCWFMDIADLNIFGTRYPGTRAVAEITFIGPAGLVFFTFQTPLGKIVLFQTHTPETQMRLRTHFRWFASASMPRFLVWYIVGAWVGQWQNDINIWENKLFTRRPMLVKGDGPMQKQRRWYSQFIPTEEDIASLGRDCSSGQDESSNTDW